MSRSGKFIPGASRRNKPKSDGGGEGVEAKSEPIRAGNSGGGGDDKKGGRRMFGRGGGRGARGGKGGRKPGQLLLFAGVAFLLIIGLGYYFYILPQQQMIAQLQAKNRQMEAERKKKEEETAAKLKELEEQMQAAKENKKGTLIVNSQPKGAVIKFGGKEYSAPARIDDIDMGEYILLVSKDGYAAKEFPVKFTADNLMMDKGTVSLERQMGDMKLRSERKNVAFIVKGPQDYTGETKGYLPLELTQVPAGTYEVTLIHKGWETPYKFKVGPDAPVDKDIKFDYGNLVISTKPDGAVVHDGMRKLGTTPLELKELKPGTRKLGFLKHGYDYKVVEIEVIAQESTEKEISLDKTKDLKTSFGMEMVWVPDLNIYVSRHEVTQSDYLTIMGTNPSSMRGGNRPVDTVTWEEAEEFCRKATARERGKGTIPSGYSFALPTEAQWSQLMRDSVIETSFTSHSASHEGSSEVGASAPNELGLYDVIGNVNEFTSTPWRGKEETRTVRGGNWLSSQSNFPDRSKAFGASDKFRDRFTGFRVILKR